MEAATDMHVLPTWVDASKQPADGGTRPDKCGRLRLLSPIWDCSNLVVEIFDSGFFISKACSSLGIPVAPVWDAKFGNRHDLLKPFAMHKLFRLLSSGHGFLAWIRPPCKTFGANGNLHGSRQLRQTSEVREPMDYIEERDED